MRVVFFGTAEFAVPSLERLLAQPDIEVAAVVTQPDRPQGRGNRLSAPPVKQLAQKHGLTVFQPERLRKSEEVLAALKSQQADFFVVAAYGQILPQRVLDLPGRAPINVHGSLLPKYRGAARVQWAIYRGESESGVTIMRMEAGLDTGPMLKKAVVAIEPEETAEALLARLAQIGADLLIQTLREFDRLVPEVQDDSQSSYAPLIDKQLYRIDWQQAAAQIRNQIRAFYPYTYTFHWKERLRILESKLTPSGSKELLSGTIINIIKGQGLEVQTGDGALLITKVQPAGKKAQSAWDYANGSRTQAGDCLGLPDSPPD